MTRKRVAIGIIFVVIALVITALFEGLIDKGWGSDKLNQLTAQDDMKNILIKRIVKVHPEWQIIKEKTARDALLVMGYNSSLPTLKPIWMLKGKKIYSVNGAAFTLTPEYELSYELNPLEAISILEQNKHFGNIPKGAPTWSTPQEAVDVLLNHGFITKDEAITMRRFDSYLDNPKNSDTEEAMKEWGKRNKILPSRIREIDSMRFGYKNIDALEKDGFVRVGEKKKQIAIREPTGPLIKLFKVEYELGKTDILIKVETDLPDGSPLMFSITKNGLKPDDRWIGNEAKTKINNGKGEVSMSLTNHKGGKLEKGKYDIGILFNSSWRDLDPNVKARVGEFGENIKTSYNGIYINSGKMYRIIEYEKKAAFSMR